MKNLLHSGLSIALVLVLSAQLPLSAVAAGVVVELPLTVEDAVRRATDANEDWQVARLRVERSRQVQRAVFAGLLPQVNLTASGVWYGGDEVVLGDRVIRRPYDGSVNLSASLVVFDGARYPEYALARERTAMTMAEAVWWRKTVIYQTKTTFYSLLAAQRQLDIALGAVELRQAYAEQAKARLSSGMALRLDVERAESQVLEAQMVVLEARGVLADSVDSLSVLIGHDEDDQILVAIVSPEQELDEPPVTTHATYLSDREDLLVLGHAVTMAQHARKMALWGMLPKLSLTSNTQYGRPTLFHPDGYAWFLTANASWPLYDGGARMARAREASLEVSERRLQLDMARRKARRAVGKAWRDWRLAHEAIDLAARQVEVAQGTYDMAAGRFQSGLGTSLEVADASQSLFSAQIGLNQAKLRSKLARAEYRYQSSLLDDAGMYEQDL